MRSKVRLSMKLLGAPASRWRVALHWKHQLAGETPALPGSWAMSRSERNNELSIKRQTPDPSQVGNRTADARRPFPSWEGSGVGSWFRRLVEESWRHAMNPKVGRVTPCAPLGVALVANGAHGVTRPTSPDWRRRSYNQLLCVFSLL